MAVTRQGDMPLHGRRDNRLTSQRIIIEKEKTVDRLEGMTIFLMVIEKGSFSGAARELRIPVQSVSRKVADLENHLGTQLLTRTTRKLSLTDAGAVFAATSRRIVDLVDEAEREAAGEFVTPRGDLVVTAPVFFGRLHLVPIVAEFLALFPDINVRLVLGDRNLDLLDDQIDMALRIGRLPDSGMIATRVGQIRGVVCASPRLLADHGVPRRPADLALLPCIATEGETSPAAWRFREPGSDKVIEVAVRARLTTAAEAAMEAAVLGLGFTRLLHYQVEGALVSGSLELVLEEYEDQPFPVHLVHAPRAHMPLKMRRFIDFVAPRLRDILTRIETGARDDTGSGGRPVSRAP